MGKDASAAEALADFHRFPAWCGRAAPRCTALR